MKKEYHAFTSKNSVISSTELLKTIRFLKIIADENRLKILSFLQGGEHCVCDIWKHLDIPQNLASHHLKVLKDAELILAHKDGKWVHYSLNRKNMQVLEKALGKMFTVKKSKN